MRPKPQVGRDFQMLSLCLDCVVIINGHTKGAEYEKAFFLFWPCIHIGFIPTPK